ncbi:hypothetical protein L615_006400000050 [Nocardioides sp. J9]|uniref:hypothetical protein n=1 Tax=unclassified Nocardioides TaxID=2615069 RepID=UPI00049171C9|nr:MULTISPECIES: hypothetical protein [unclassified Nocardioides]TWG93223.1 hypothetical protein L615_006400000050 [Nocardioides sp. J9]
MSFILEPEVPGEIGERGELDTSVHPPRVVRFHITLTGWLGDDLLEVFPVYLVTERLASILEESDLSGYALAEADVTVDEEALIDPSLELPTFRWLQVTGSADDDVSLAEDFRLRLSDRAYELVSRTSLQNCDVEEV